MNRTSNTLRALHPLLGYACERGTRRRQAVFIVLGLLRYFRWRGRGCGTRCFRRHHAWKLYPFERRHPGQLHALVGRREGRLRVPLRHHGLRLALGAHAHTRRLAGAVGILSGQKDNMSVK